MDIFQYTWLWGSEESIQERYGRYKTMLYRIAFSYLHNRHDCEDVLQEAFIKLCYSAPEFPGEEDEKRWLIRVTINLCKSHLRSFWNRNRRSMDELENYAVLPQEKEELMEIFALPSKYRIVIHLHYMEGYRISEIAGLLKLSISAVKMRLKRGRELLKIELEGAHED